MLIDAEDWRRLSEKPTWIDDDEKFILTYYLGRSVPIDKGAAKKFGLKIINLLDPSNYDHYIVNLEEFLWLVDHANIVYTNSFHGTCFSILLNTPFVTVAPESDPRIRSILTMFNLRSRIGKPENNFTIDNLFEIDFEPVEKILERERIHALTFLENSLGVAK